MLFSLEALEARKGDALILHFGISSQSPRFIVIDGGPATVYRNRLKPRLQQLWHRWKQEDDKLDINMLMVSHIDDDHLRGVIDWLSDIEDTQSATPYNIQTLWFNSFEEILGADADELHSRLAESEAVNHLAGVIASVPQGRRLRAQGQGLAIPPNRGFAGLVMCRDAGSTVVRIAPGLTFHVLCPSQQRLTELHTIWERDMLRHPGSAETAAFADRSVANLSSIVVAAEMTADGVTRRMLLTGDARGDHILEGLHNSDLPRTDSGWHFDVFKIPHHGSDRNATEGMFRTITADHYLISANGEHDNPDASILHWIARGRGADPYTIHITNRELVNPSNGNNVSAIINAAIEQTAAQAVNRRIAYRDEARLSLCVDVGTQAVDY